MIPGRDEDQLPFSKAADVYAFGTVWYELQARDWPFKHQPAEALIWQIGSGKGVKRVLASVSLGKEVGVSRRKQGQAWHDEKDHRQGLWLS